MHGLVWILGGSWKCSSPLENLSKSTLAQLLMDQELWRSTHSNLQTWFV